MYLLQAVINIVGEGVDCCVEGDKLVWRDTKRTQPNQGIIDAEVLRLEAAYKAVQYQRDRAVEYAKLNQDELRFNDMMNGTTTWKDAVLAIKAKYPKPV